MTTALTKANKDLAAALKRAAAAEKAAKAATGGATPTK